MEIQATKGVMMVGERLPGVMPAGRSIPVLQQGHLIISKPTRGLAGWLRQVTLSSHTRWPLVQISQPVMTTLTRLF